ncbi:glycosyltransferase family 4 protein [Pararhizobium sp.]|uniref:glycosyltransferase family 4 protein n=1 Tax=Pararhizobium sp. TaxID=1977563 RepID=UPI002718ADAD|nr:glycosyltransferase family 4 protein [Pararhizobium sp.]MDO9415984.1 glycosyltransferase family 4 protein [Pararhizobium sp.]
MANADPLRILHCFRSPVGGIFRHVRDLTEAHAKAGHQVGILCDSSTGGAHEEALFDCIRPHLALGLVRMPIKRSIGPGDVGAFWKSYKEIRSLRPDVLHGHGAKGGAISRLIGSALRVNKYRVARLYSPHGGSLHFEKRSLAGRVVFRAERALEHLTDGMAFVCDFERQTYTDKVGKPKIRNELIYNGIDDREFEPVAAVADAVDFLYFGMLRDMKGPDVFIAAFAEAERRAGRPLSALMIGDGPDRDAYAKTILEKGYGRRIIMLPPMKAREAFALAHTVIIPSRAESMPYVVLEALAARKCVIATRVGGIPEVLGADSAALCPPGDPEALSQLMAEAVMRPEWLAGIMPDADDFRAKFAASTMAADVLKLYRDLDIRTPN